jgi:hypothetical protein
MFFKKNLNFTSTSTKYWPLPTCWKILSEVVHDKWKMQKLEWLQTIFQNLKIIICLHIFHWRYIFFKQRFVVLNWCALTNNLEIMSKYTIDLMYSARKVFQENMVVGVYTESKCFKKKHWHQHTKSCCHIT